MKVVELTPEQSPAMVIRRLAGLDGGPHGLVTRRGRTPRLGIVTTDAPFLKGSIRRNLLLGSRRPRSDDDLAAILDTFGAAAALAGRGGLRAAVHEDGEGLDAPMRVRLLLARAVAMEAQAILCDGALIGLLADGGDLLARAAEATRAPVVVFEQRASAAGRAA